MKVVIDSPVLHDGSAFQVGDAPNLPKEVAEALIACGAALPAVKAAEPAAEA